MYPFFWLLSVLFVVHGGVGNEAYSFSRGFCILLSFRQREMERKGLSWGRLVCIIREKMKSKRPHTHTTNGSAFFMFVKGVAWIAMADLSPAL